jgi:hypothetical protein
LQGCLQGCVARLHDSTSANHVFKKIIQHYCPISPCFKLFFMLFATLHDTLPSSLALQLGPAALPFSYARQSCPAELPGSLALKLCPATLPGSLDRQPCSAAL